jgi:hypothetical protein
MLAMFTFPVIMLCSANPLKVFRKTQRPLSGHWGIRTSETHWPRHFFRKNPKHRCIKVALKPNHKITQRLVKVKQNFVKKKKKAGTIQLTVISRRWNVIGISGGRGTLNQPKKPQLRLCGIFNLAGAGALVCPESGVSTGTIILR